MSPPAAEPGTPPKKGRGRWFKARVILAALVLVIGSGLYLNWRNTLPATVVGEVGSGHAYVDVPIMAFYTPDLAVAGFRTSANVTFAAIPSYATRIAFTWNGVKGASLPVRFVFVPDTGSFASGERLDVGPTDGFLFYPAGVVTPPVTSSSTTFGTVNPGADGLYWKTWRIDYAVREMSVHDWLQDDHWLEVDYSITGVFAEFGYMPAANTSHPQPADLVPVGPPLNVSYQAGFPWAYAWTLRNTALPPGPFTHTVGSVSFSAGAAGTISANLTSAFQWGPNDGYEVRASGSGPAVLSLRAYVDMRFGSLVVESLA